MLMPRLLFTVRFDLLRLMCRPANILWLPLSKCWTLIDFGCTADIGVQRPAAIASHPFWQQSACIHLHSPLLLCCGKLHSDLMPCIVTVHCVSMSPFCCAADSEAPIMFSIQYAAPEVIAALCSGARTLTASGAVDIWVR